MTEEEARQILEQADYILDIRERPAGRRRGKVLYATQGEKSYQIMHYNNLASTGRITFSQIVERVLAEEVI